MRRCFVYWRGAAGSSLIAIIVTEDGVTADPNLASVPPTPNVKTKKTKKRGVEALLQDPDGSAKPVKETRARQFYHPLKTPTAQEAASRDADLQKSNLGDWLSDGGTEGKSNGNYG